MRVGIYVCIYVLRHISINGYLHLEKIKVEKFITYLELKLNKNYNVSHILNQTDIINSKIK
jgi:hypothetical protein